MEMTFSLPLRRSNRKVALFCDSLEIWFLKVDVVLQRTSIFKAVMILFVFVFMNTDSILF